MDGKKLLKEINGSFRTHRNEEIAIGMENYLRNQFECYGIKSPQRTELLRPYLISFKQLADDQWPEAVMSLWNFPQREMQYAAMECFYKRRKDYKPEHLGLIEQMIVTKSWWDTVDFIASNITGEFFKKYPELIHPTVERWTKSSNFWLHRVTIIFQLKYGVKTDKELLFKLCTLHSREKEFFIRKAIGWALRQFSKSNPADVRKYVKSHYLSPLSLKEASKYI